MSYLPPFVLSPQAATTWIQTPQLAPPLDRQILELLALAVQEDLGSAGDRTVALSIEASATGLARIVARQPGILSGLYLLPALLAYYAPTWDLRALARDGQAVKPHEPLVEIRGPMGALLSAERVALNFLGHLSGIATLTHRYVQTVEAAVGPGRKVPLICDTRKTTPGFRTLDKYAVRCGGGHNHRMGLYDGVMLKDNHLVALQQRFGGGLSLAELTRRIRTQLPASVTLWLEVDTLAQLAEALPGAADVILLDNMTPQEMIQAVAMRAVAMPGGAGPLLEASGGVSLETLAAIAATGVDRISIGALTHSAGVLDLSMEMLPEVR